MQGIQANPQNPVFVPQPVPIPNRCTTVRICKIALYAISIFSYTLSLVSLGAFFFRNFIPGLLFGYLALKGGGYFGNIAGSLHDFRNPLALNEMRDEAKVLTIKDLLRQYTLSEVEQYELVNQNLLKDKILRCLESISINDFEFMRSRARELRERNLISLELRNALLDLQLGQVKQIAGAALGAQV